ncbi:reticulon-1-A-like isoform X2 [Xenia sp. Carnegie-2017]|uniref:reticulon-1-A-like isoform X2 n=1 Tax=Xenia sp. Carnegie-2017 TaxID=2897299 RepID=UPI001F045EF5|nr:reticulon-1-A-like isoform X2 [Xenia sp. Carnegie-2017]
MIYGSTSDKGMPQALKIFLNECRRILLVEDVIDTVKVLIIVHLLSYLGDWFSGSTLLYMCVFVAFTIPKFYDVYRQEILRILEKATNVMEDAKDKILSFIPSKSKSPSWKKENGIKTSRIQIYMERFLVFVQCCTSTFNRRGLFWRERSREISKKN